jgi:transcriptional regulator GlxA family with amidase domain
LPLSDGLEIASTNSLTGYVGDIDTLIVSGGLKAIAASDDPQLVSAVKVAAGRARRVVSLCTGDFILAAAGLLDGRRAVTHWRHGEQLAARYPRIKVDIEPIFIRDGKMWTSAGVMASFDLLLALVQEDFGTEVARSVARSLVLFLRRTGSQAQFSRQLATQLSDQHPIRELQQYIADHPAADLTLSTLAERLHMSVRHLARVFRQEVGVSPGQYVQGTRIETARRRLEETELGVKSIAADCGFGSSESLRRVFVQTLGVSPSEYRQRFGGEGNASKAFDLAG